MSPAIRTFIGVAILSACALGSTGAIAIEGRTGTLTCTLSPSYVDGALAADARISCHFKAISGADLNLSGQAIRLGVDQQRNTKNVLVWSVYVDNKDFVPEDLEGRYVGALEEKRGSVLPDGTGLVGGRGNAIMLKPLTTNPNIPEGWGITILNLELVPVEV